MWFDGWDSIGRTILAGAVAYVAVVIVLRVSGKRTLAKMNAFDLIVTVALGSTLSTVLVSKDVSIASGVVALAMLVVLQYLVASLMIRSKRFQRLVKSQPARLFAAGHFDDEKMREERIVHEEVLAAMRSSGYTDPAQVEEVYLETDGSLSVIPRRSG
ncbi:MAG TPA: YetF domain-containing protein [Thermoanaerobaculia bacterium]|nr:YetF domain-containing protein [Thermoanaerobaculia bacterium]